MQFLAEEHGEDALDLMRELKHAFDPNNIMNPGKVVPLYQEGSHSS
jgi:D-lactate dehydrogenase (cytochrome)